MSAEAEYAYWAFISYSHRDERWARWLHRAIESYRVPRPVVGRDTPYGSLPRRLVPVFRDRDELPVAADLGATIRSALRQSRFLVVICSPHSAVSKWVSQEVRDFKALGREAGVLCFIVDGEPYASENPDSGLLECLPRAVRFRVGPDGEVGDERADPLAADAREGKDARENATLKLLAGMLGVGFDDLHQRERRRRVWARTRAAALGTVFAASGLLAYSAAADDGVSLPGGEQVRTLLDRHEASVFRPVASDGSIRAAAADLRATTLPYLATQARSGHWAPTRVSREVGAIVDVASWVWVSSQALCAGFRAPEAKPDDLLAMLDVLKATMSPGVPVERAGTRYGWYAEDDEQLQAEPALWTVAATAVALGRRDLLRGEAREQAVAWLAYAEDAARTYGPALDGGWNMFPGQVERDAHNTYSTTLALLALLEARAAGHGWDASGRGVDATIRGTIDWLIGRYEAGGTSPGWRADPTVTGPTQDGLTLQIFAELLRAEEEGDVVLPGTILGGIWGAIADLGTRPFDFPETTGYFGRTWVDPNGKRQRGSQVIFFDWYPWAIDCATRWMRRAIRTGAPHDVLVRARRVLGHLVVDLAPQVRDSLKDADAETFTSSEQLYALSTIPP